MFICEKGYSCCNYMFADKIEDVDSEGRACGHLQEVAYVIHAKWEKVPLKKYPDEYKPVCSHCKSSASAEYNFCPTCGAKMEPQEVKDEI